MVTIIRVLIAGVLGGALVFCAGAFNHMVLGLEGRAFKQFAHDDEVLSFLRTQELKPGLYRFPGMPAGFEKLSGDEKSKAYERWNERYKQGPSGLMVVAPAGEDAMGPPQLIAEFVTDVLAALIAACIVAALTPGRS